MSSSATGAQGRSPREPAAGRWGGGDEGRSPRSLARKNSASIRERFSDHQLEDLDAALAAAHDMGLPVALSPDVVEELDFRPDPPGSAEYDIAEEEALDQ